MDFSDKLFNAMAENNLSIEGDIDWSNYDFQRFPFKGRGRKKPLFVILFKGGASFGDWRNPSTWQTIWDKSWGEICPAERTVRLDYTKQMQAERQLLRSHAIWRAQSMLDHKTFLGSTCIEASENHPYILKKRIKPYYAYQIRSYIILPIIDIAGSLKSLQYIKPNGFKQFKKHASPKGGFVFLGEEIHQSIDPIWICEGWATGCSIYEAVGKHVVCSLGASNIELIALQFRQAYPCNTIIICADNDQQTRDNVGLKYGKMAADSINAPLVFPNFNGYRDGLNLSDFNDLFCIAGIEEVEKQLFNY